MQYWERDHGRWTAWLQHEDPDGGPWARWGGYAYDPEVIRPCDDAEPPD